MTRDVTGFTSTGLEDLDAALAETAELLVDAGHAVALTGAGVSKESGIPTFRGEDGLWTKHGEPPLNQFDTFREDPERWWERRLEDHRNPTEFTVALEGAQPNAGHFAMAELERLGALSHVITQNVDDLHRRAGQQSISEIHGNRHWLRCAECHSRWPREEVIIDEHQLPPLCSQPDCNGVVKGDGVMFGEPIPPDALQQCGLETRLADLFLVVGTIAVVYPAAQYPQLAAQRGVPLIEIDPEPTAISDQATVILRGPAGELLPRIVDALKSRGSA